MIDKALRLELATLILMFLKQKSWFQNLELYKF